MASSIAPGVLGRGVMSFVMVACSFGCTYGAIWHAAKNCASLTGLPFHGWSSIRQRMMSSGISPEINA